MRRERDLDPPPDPKVCTARASPEVTVATNQRASLGFARGPVEAPEAGAASSVLQPRRDAPPWNGLLGDRSPPIGARSRSRGRRPRPGKKGSLVAPDAQGRWMKKAPPPSRAGVGTDLRGVGAWPSSRARCREAPSLHPTPPHLPHVIRAAQPHFVVALAFLADIASKHRRTAWYRHLRPLKPCAA